MIRTKLSSKLSGSSAPVTWLSVLTIVVVAPLLTTIAISNPIEGLAIAVLILIGVFFVVRKPPGTDALTFGWVPFAWVAMMFVSDHQFLDTLRSPLAAAEGDASTENLFELLVYAYVAAMVFRSRHALVGRYPTRIPKLILLLFPGFAVMSALWSPIAIFSLTRASQLLVVAALTLLMVRVWQASPQLGAELWTATLRSFVQSVTVLALIGMILGMEISGRFTWPGTHPGVATAWTGLALLVLVVGDRAARPFPTWSHPFRLALFVVVLVLGQTRTVFAALALAGLVVLWDLGREKPIARYLGIGYYAAALLALLTFAGDQIFGFLSRGESAEVWTTLSGRVPLWEAAIDDLSAAGSWVQGFGYGAARVVLYPDFQWAGTAHNSWMEALIGTGIIGLVLLLADVVFVLWQLAWRLPPTRTSRTALGMLVYLLILSGTSELLAVPSLGYIVLGLIHVPGLGGGAHPPSPLVGIMVPRSRVPATQ
jgi:O-antigen ligase